MPKAHLPSKKEIEKAKKAQKWVVLEAEVNSPLPRVSVFIVKVARFLIFVGIALMLAYITFKLIL